MRLYRSCHWMGHVSGVKCSRLSLDDDHGSWYLRFRYEVPPWGPEEAHRLV